MEALFQINHVHSLWRHRLYAMDVKSDVFVTYLENRIIVRKKLIKNTRPYLRKRGGIPIKGTFYEIDRIITAGINQGQHLYHIMKTNNLGISTATVYRRLHKGYLSVSKMEFPRVVKFKQRKQPHTDYIPKAAKAGRT